MNYQQIGRLRSGDYFDFAKAKAKGKAKGRSTSGQVKNCSKGFPCGFSCLSRDKSCKSVLPGQAKTYFDWMQMQAQAGKPQASAQPAAAQPAAAQPAGKSPAPGGTSQKSTSTRIPRLKDVGDLDEVAITKTIGGDKLEVVTFQGSLQGILGKPHKNGANALDDLWGHEIAFLVNNNLSRGASTNPIRTTLAALKTIEKEVLPSYPNGAVVFNKPHSDDGFGSQRAALYEKRGFGKLGKSGYQFAVVKSGKLIPISEDELQKRI